jgi:hypothetical protein
MSVERDRLPDGRAVILYAWPDDESATEPGDSEVDVGDQGGVGAPNGRSTEQR